MQTSKTETHGRQAIRPLVAILAAAAGCGAAWADEPSPWYIGVNQALTHDSNVYRIPDGPGDTYSSTGLRGGFDQPIGRQRLFADAHVHYNKYQDQDVLNNTSYGVHAGWDWATIEKLAGSVSASANQSLAGFEGNAVRPLADRNLVKTDQLATSVRWGGDGLLTLDGSYAHSRVRYSAPEFLSSESSADTGSVGASYRVGADLRVGGALRYTRTVSPYAVALVAVPVGPDDYESNTGTARHVDLTADWRTTAQTGVNARLSWTRLTNSTATGQDFSGLTGAVSANYAPTAKLTFNASLSRDAGTNAAYFNTVGTPTTAPVVELSGSTRTTDGVTLGAGYAATAKINVNAGFRYRHAKVVDSFTGDEQTDNLRISSLGVTYDIARSWQLACNLGHESRGVSGAPGYAYTANTAGCSAQFTLR